MSDNSDYVDYQIRDEGTVVLLWPISGVALGWVDQYLPEDAQRFGSAFVIDHRCAEDIVNGLCEDGLVGRVV